AMGQFKNAFSRIIQDIQNTLHTLAMEREHLEEKVVERTEVLENRMSQLRSATTTARLVAEIQDISELLETSTNLLTERFGFYHVGLFILDENKKNAYLQSSSSANGKNLIGQAFSLESNRKHPLTLAL